ncbi:MAG: hypothetical protein ABIR24_11835 [Verrucomicrobiota bacterium]
MRKLETGDYSDLKDSLAPLEPREKQLDEILENLHPGKEMLPTPQTGMKDFFENWGCLSLVVVVILLVCVSQFRSCSKKKSIQTSAELVQENRNAIALSLAEKHGAATNWSEAIPENRRSMPFSIDLSRALIRNDSKPVLVRCELSDVTEEAGKIFAKFDLSENYEYGLTEGVLKLECTPEYFAMFEKGQGGRYAVIAKCYDIKPNSLSGCTIIGTLLDAVKLNEE